MVLKIAHLSKVFQVSTPLLSIIIPAFNAERTIARTLGALSTETSSFEVIVVNDGSTDRTLSIVELFSNLKMNLKIITQKNAGPGISRNIGIEAATGKYLTFCDADDLALLSNQLKLVNMANEHGAQVACGTGFSFYNYQTMEPFHDHHISRLIGSNLTNIEEKKILRFLLEPTACTKIFLKSFIIGNQIHFSHGQFEDVLFTYMALMKASHFVLEPLPLFIYIINKSISRSREQSMSRFDIFTSVSEILQQLIQGQLQTLEVAALSISMMKLTLWCFENVPEQGLSKFKTLIFNYFVLLRLKVNGDNWLEIERFISSPLEQRAFRILYGLLHLKWSEAEFNNQLEFIRARP